MIVHDCPMTNTNATAATIKITRLTGDNVRALHEAQAAGCLPAGTAISKTTAEFPCDARTAVAAIDDAKARFNARYGTSRNNLTASIAAPRRKLVALIP